jgi:hypothetical protein
MYEKKLDTDPYLDKLAESYPELYEEILVEFLKRPETRVAISRHEKTPPEILRTIASDIGAPWESILSNPNCPIEIIEKKLKSGEDDALIYITQNCAIDESTIRSIAKSSYSPVLTWVSRRPDCPPDVLEGLFKLYEEQWNNLRKRVSQETTSDDSGTITDDFLLDGSEDYWLEYDTELDDALLEAIAGNPNTPQHVFKKMMTMEVKRKRYDDTSLGSTLMNNPSVSAEDKAFLSLQGISETKDNLNVISSMISHYGLPTSHAFEYSKFPLKFLEALNELGHPSGLLHPRLRIIPNQKYDFNELVDSWIKYETIYRTLWPELKEREDVNFLYWRSSYNGDNFFFSCKGVDFEHFFDRYSQDYNSMGFPFNERPWAETVETMDIEMSNENFWERDILDLFEYGEDGEQYDLILAAVVSKSSWVKEVESPEFTLTKKGEAFVCENAESFFVDDRSVKVEVLPEKALPYSWKAIPLEKKIQITRVIIEGFNKKVDTKYQFAEHFLTCIALNPATPEEIRKELAAVDSKLVSQALAVS